MSTALVPWFYGRPPWVRQGDDWIAVSVHDAAHVLTRARLRQAIRAAGHTQRKLRRAVVAYLTFLSDEREWYGRLDLDPPARKWPPERPRERRSTIRGRALRASGGYRYRIGPTGLHLRFGRRHCRRGHELTRWNLVKQGRTRGPRCGICQRDSARKHRQRKGRHMANGKAKPNLDLQGIYTGRGGKHGKRILEVATKASAIEDKRERLTYLLGELNADLNGAKTIEEVRELTKDFTQNHQAWISLALA